MSEASRFELKERIEGKIKNAFDVTSKVATIDTETFQPVLAGDIEYVLPVEILQDAKYALTELEIYILVGKTIMDKISAAEVTHMSVSEAMQQVTGDL